MSKSRLEAFSDGIIAIVITLLVLGLTPPKEVNWKALLVVRHSFLVYIISFVTLAIYWNNHHHLLHIVKQINGKVLWANNFFLFSLTLFPYATAWIGDHITSLVPQLLYGFVVFLADFSYFLLYKTLVFAHPKEKFHTEKKDLMKMYLSMVVNVIAFLSGLFIHPLCTLVLNTLVLLSWFIPDKKKEETSSFF